MSDFDLENATREEMEAYYTDVMGLKVHHNIGDDALRSKISEYLVSSEPPPAPAKKVRVKAKRFRVIIPKVKGGIDPVPIGVNGVIFTVNRGVEVNLPEPYLDVLKNAIQTVYDPETMDKSEVSAYPYQILGEAV